MAIKLSRLVGLIALSIGTAIAQEADYLGVLNGNEALIDSVSNESGTLTGEFSTRSVYGPTENAQWQIDGPLVISTSGVLLGQLSTVPTTTNSLFNETIWVQVPFMDRCEACIGSMNSKFSIDGPKIYDSQSSLYKDMIGELINERH